MKGNTFVAEEGRNKKHQNTHHPIATCVSCFCCCSLRCCFPCTSHWQVRVPLRQLQVPKIQSPVTWSGSSSYGGAKSQKSETFSPYFSLHLSPSLFASLSPSATSASAAHLAQREERVQQLRVKKKQPTAILFISLEIYISPPTQGESTAKSSQPLSTWPNLPYKK